MSTRFVVFLNYSYLCNIFKIHFLWMNIDSILDQTYK